MNWVEPEDDPGPVRPQKDIKICRILITQEQLLERLRPGEIKYRI